MPCQPVRCENGMMKKKKDSDQKLCARLEDCGKTQSTAARCESQSRHRLATALSFACSLQPPARDVTWQAITYNAYPHLPSNDLSSQQKKDSKIHHFK